MFIKLFLIKKQNIEQKHQFWKMKLEISISLPIKSSFWEFPNIFANIFL